MERSEAAAHVEHANYDGGLKSAYQTFSDEIHKITSSSANQSDADQKIKQMTETLEKDGLLPGISAYWAQQQFGLMQNDEVNKRDLGAFVDRKNYDRVATELGSELQNHYDQFSSRTWLNPNLNSKDLQITIDGYEADRVKDHKEDDARKVVDMLKKDNFKLFDKLSGLDGDNSSLSWFDLYQAKNMSKILDPKEGSPFSAEDAKLLQNIDIQALSDVTHIGSGNLTKDKCTPDTAYRKHSWELTPPAVPSNPEAKPNPEKSTDQKEEPKHPQTSDSQAKPSVPGNSDKCPVEIPNKNKAHNEDPYKDLPPVEAPHFKLPQLQMPDGDLRYFYAHDPKNLKTVEIKDGDGYDRIARRELKKLNTEFTEADVLRYSDEIARMNGEKGRQGALIDKSKPVYLPEYKANV